MDEFADQERAPRRWVPQTIAGLLGVVAVGVGIALVVPTMTAPNASETAPAEDVDTGDDEDISEDPIAAAAATPAPMSSDEDAEVARATVAVDALVAAGDEIAQRGDGSAVGLDSIATGWALGELQSRAREQYDLGYQQVGDATVTSVTPSAVDLTASPATITLTVCVDVSGIDVLDAAGNSLKASLYNPGRPVAHVYGAVFEDDTWKISTHEIPDAQGCPAA